MPHTALIEAIRGIALTGANITQNATQVLVGVGWLAASLLLPPWPTGSPTNDPACLSGNWHERCPGVCYEPRMRDVIRPVASLQELARVFDLVGAQLPQPLTRHDRRLAELARRFPADHSLMLLAEDQGRIVGGALALGEALRLVSSPNPRSG